MREAGIETEVQVVAYAAIVALWVVALLVATRAVRAEGGRRLAASGD